MRCIKTQTYAENKYDLLYTHVRARGFGALARARDWVTTCMPAGALLASALTLALCGWALYLTVTQQKLLHLVLTLAATLALLLPFAAILPDRLRPWRLPNKTA